jgi:hypothetical protein
MLYSSLSELFAGQYTILYIDSNLTIPASSTGGRYIKVTQVAAPNDSCPVIIDDNGQITNIPNLC